MLLRHGASGVGKTSTAGEDMSIKGQHDILLTVYQMCCGPVSEA